MNESPYERVIRQDREQRERRDAREAEEKLAMGYGVIQVSERRWRVIRYEGMAFEGDPLNPATVAVPRFEFKTEALNHLSAWEECKRLNRERRAVLDAQASKG